jgi:hypothetical protein
MAIWFGECKGRNLQDVGIVRVKIILKMGVGHNLRQEGSMAGIMTELGCGSGCVSGVSDFSAPAAPLRYAASGRNEGKNNIPHFDCSMAWSEAERHAERRNPTDMVSKLY